MTLIFKHNKEKYTIHNGVVTGGKLENFVSIWLNHYPSSPSDGNCWYLNAMNKLFDDDIEVIKVVGEKSKKGVVY